MGAAGEEQLLHQNRHQQQRRMGHLKLHSLNQDCNSSGREATVDVPKGCMGIMVGLQGEEPQRFVIPAVYVNHPLFGGFLKEAEEEFGFHYDGPISIPCNVHEFLIVQDLIDRDYNGHKSWWPLQQVDSSI